MIKRLAIIVGLCSALALHAQTVQPILQPHVTYVDASGTPCVGCLLYSYAAGTTTPLATYADSGGVIQNTNPVVLDVAGGEQIWLGSSAYKFILKTSLGTTIWTVDNVTGFLSYCSKSGCTMTGPLTVSGGLITASSGIATTTLTASGQITASGGITGTLTGAASLNVLKAGDSMSGALQIGANGNALGMTGNGNYLGANPLNHASFLEDGIVPGDWWNFTNSFTNSESEVYAGMITSSGSTQSQTTSLAGVNIVNSNFTNGVGVYGAGVCNTNGAHCWGGNFLVSDKTVTGPSSLMWGVEADNNVYNSTTTGYAFNAIGYMEAQSTKMIAMEISRPIQGAACTTCAWTGGVQVEEGAVMPQAVTGAPPYGVGLLLNPVTYGSSTQNSQLIGMVSRDSLGVLNHVNIYSDPDGNLQFCTNNEFASTTNNCSGVDGAGGFNSKGNYQVTPSPGISHTVIPNSATGYHGAATGKVQLSDGTGAANDCVKFDSFGTLTTSGAPCGGTGVNASALQGVNIDSTAPTSGQVLAFDGTNWIPTTSTSTPTFSAITGSTNTTAAMVCGTGCSIATSGSGTNQATSLTGNITESQVTNLTTDLAAKVANTTTVNGHALSANVTVSASDISTGTLPNAQLPSAISRTSVTATEFITSAEFSNGTCTTAKTIDPANGNKQKVTLTAASTCALTFTQPGAGTTTVQLKVTQSSSGSFNGGISGCKWPGGVVPTITQTSGAIDMISIYLDGTNAYCQIAQAFS